MKWLYPLSLIGYKWISIHFNSNPRLRMITKKKIFFLRVLFSPLHSLFITSVQLKWNCKCLRKPFVWVSPSVNNKNDNTPRNTHRKLIPEERFLFTMASHPHERPPFNTNFFETFGYIILTIPFKNWLL